MIKLFGFSLSNYYNKVKIVLLAKGLDFEEVAVRRRNLGREPAEFLRLGGRRSCRRVDVQRRIGRSAR